VPELKTKKELAEAAKTLASSYELVQRGSTTFIPVHWQTLSPEPTPSPEESIWLPLDRDDKKELAAKKSQILFSTDGELRSFEFMLGQLARLDRGLIDGILIKTPQGPKMLNDDGKLVDPTGRFTPNYVRPVLNEDPVMKQKVMDVLIEWLDGEDVARSLLHHLATVLNPNYSAVKYVLLLGEGRNGKGVLLAMLSLLFGDENVSNITRQMMSEKSPTIAELNNKLINIVFDGEEGYIKESSMEKTLIAGERGVVKLLYESGTTNVQTNALFIEGLQKEPKARDKSQALQKRLTRFWFPKIYKLDKTFHKEMTSEPMLGAFLSLLIDHYVREDEVAEKLELTQASMELQLEQVYLGSPILQFLEELYRTDPVAMDKVVKGTMPVDTFLGSFKPWAMSQHLPDRGDGDLLTMMKTVFNIGWKTFRVEKVPTSKRTIKSLRPETILALNQMKGPADDDIREDQGTVEPGGIEDSPGSDGGTPQEAQADSEEASDEGVGS